jgi:hypothetical protein
MYFASHVLSPLSFAIKTDLQIGNLPACFFELRMMLESMVKCFWADLDYKEIEHFMGKLQLLEKKIDKRETSTSKLLENMGHEYCALWSIDYRKIGCIQRVTSKGFSNTPQIGFLKTCDLNA